MMTKPIKPDSDSEDLPDGQLATSAAVALVVVAVGVVMALVCGGLALAFLGRALSPWL